MIKRIRAVFRLFYFALRTFNEIVVLSVVSLFKGIDVDFALRRRRRYARHLFPLMGMRTYITGKIPDYPCILIGNHRCYLDPAVVISDVLGFPVSKAEVESWPLIGYGAKLTGVLYLKRESPNSRKKTLDGISDKIEEGYPVILYPEGTTGSQETTMKFRLGSFKLAVEKGIPIVPMAIEYGNDRDYWGAEAPNFILHFLERFGEPKMYVWLRYGEPMRADNPEELLEKAQTWINAQILEMKAERAVFLSNLEK